MSRNAGKLVVAAIMVVVSIVVVAILVSRDDESGDDPTVVATSAPTESVSSSTPTATASTAPPEPAKGSASLTDPVQFGAGSRVQITKIESVTSQAELPGETSRPALRFTVKVTAAKESIDLAGVVVNAYYGADRTPAIGIGEPGASPFEGQLKADASTTGVYIFNVPVKERDDVEIEFFWAADEDPVVLTGAVH